MVLLSLPVQYSTGGGWSHLLPVQTGSHHDSGGLAGITHSMPAPAGHSQLPTWGSLLAGSPATGPFFCRALPAQGKLAQCHLPIKSIIKKKARQAEQDMLNQHSTDHWPVLGLRPDSPVCVKLPCSAETKHV